MTKLIIYQILNKISIYNLRKNVKIYLIQFRFFFMHSLAVSP